MTNILRRFNGFADKIVTWERLSIYLRVARFLRVFPAPRYLVLRPPTGTLNTKRGIIFHSHFYYYFYFTFRKCRR